jgi:hypothetical protein
MRIRTETMTYSGSKNKIKRDIHDKLKDEIARLDEDYMDNPTDDVQL